MKSQHERITIIDGRKVEVVLCEGCKPLVLAATCVKGELQLTGHICVQLTDRKGREALRIATECFDQTGEFTGLATDNAIPFVGKWVRMEGRDNPLIIAEVGKYWVRFAGWSDSTGVGSLLPLEPPAKKYRKMTPAEAVGLLGEKVRHTMSGRLYELAGIRKDHAELTSREHSDVSVSLDVLCSDYMWSEWAGMGKPCGIEIKD